MSSLGQRLAILATCGLIGAVLLAPDAAQAAAPTCQNVSATTLPGQPLTAPNPCTDPDNNPFTAFSATTQNGTVTPNADGTVTYTPNAGFVGHDTFTFTATAGGETSAPATADILVDTPPTCSNNTKTVQSGSRVVISIDTDILCDDADAPPTLDIFIGNPQHGTLTDGPGNAVTYTPDPGFTGTDSFPYAARDEFLVDSNTATMTIAVTPAPVVTPTPTPTPTPRPAPDITPPTIAIIHPKQRVKNANSKGVTLIETSNEPGTLSVRITVDKKTARKLKIKRNARRAVLIGTLTEAIHAGQTTLHIKLSSKARNALKRARNVKLLITVTVTDAAGNKTTKTLHVTLKR